MYSQHLLFHNSHLTAFCSTFPLTHPFSWMVKVLLRYICKTHTHSMQHEQNRSFLTKGRGLSELKVGPMSPEELYFWYIWNTRHCNAFQPPRGGAFCQCYNHLITRGQLSFQHGTRDQTFFADRFMSFVSLPSSAGVTPWVVCRPDKVYRVRGNELRGNEL